MVAAAEKTFSFVAGKMLLGGKYLHGKTWSVKHFVLHSHTRSTFEL